MSLTTSPSVEAMQAIVTQINGGAGIVYTLPNAATYGYVLEDDVKGLATLKVDVIGIDEMTLKDSLETEDRSSHQIEVWIRKKLPAKWVAADVDALALIVRQIWRRLNLFTTSRVCVRECGEEPAEMPDKTSLRDHGVFRFALTLRVEVEAST